MRTVRLNVPGVVYHLIWRFVDREWFFNCDEERETYLRFLANALSDCDWRCLAYALMSNHIHLAMVAGEAPLASWSKRVTSPFAMWMNRRHDRIGPLMADRPKDFAILPENEGRLIAYVHNNPVRAGVVAAARESSWTSHRAYLGDAHVPPWLRVSEGLARAGFDSPGLFDEWVRATPGVSGETDLRPVQRAARRRGGVQVATPTVLDDKARIPLVARSFAHIRPDPSRLVEIVSEVTQLPSLMVRSRRQSRGLVSARRIAAHCGRACGLTNADLARTLGISAQAVSKQGSTKLSTAERALLEIVFESPVAGVGTVPKSAASSAARPSPLPPARASLQARAPRSGTRRRLARRRRGR